MQSFIKGVCVCSLLTPVLLGERCWLPDSGSAILEARRGKKKKRKEEKEVEAELVVVCPGVSALVGG